MGSVVQILILAIVVAGVIGVALVIFNRLGVAVPDWIMQVIWIVLAVVIGVMAIRFIASLGWG